MQKDVYIPRTLGNTRRRDPDWSHDGSFLNYDGFDSETPGIYKQAIDNSAVSTRVVEGNATDPNLSPDGKWLSFLSDTNLWLYDLESGLETKWDSSSGSQQHPDF